MSEKTITEKDIKKLPYIFRDFHALDKKIDPKKLQFGSRIDSSGSVQREDYYSVKEIISPELLRLNDNSIIRLIGIKQKNTVNSEAMEFLRLKTKNQRVFMKFDKIKYDNNNNLMAYVYLKNKTFLNAHLIKKGLADVDLSYNFRNRTRFINYANKKMK